MVNLAHTLAVLVLAIASAARAETTSTDRTASAIACTVRVSKFDLEAGVDVVTDTSCKTGDEGCVDTACRACKHWDSEWSKELPSCHTFMRPPTPEETTVANTLSVAMSTHGNANVGLKTIGNDSRHWWKYTMCGGIGVAAAVAAMAFAVKRATNTRSDAPETMSPSGSLVYRRASVFHI